jgi:hypothetical protein
MGEIADQILNGDMCEGCGEWMGEGDGYPRRCPGCLHEENEAKEKIKQRRSSHGTVQQGKR